MNAATIAGLAVGILALLSSTSGWLAYLKQRQQARQDEARYRAELRASVAATVREEDTRRLATLSGQREYLERLDILVGEWLAAITRISSAELPLPTIGRNIIDFNEDRGGYETRVAHALNRLPETEDYARIRDSIDSFRSEAFTIKGGWIQDLIISRNHGPISREQWLEIRSKALQELGKVCDRAQELIETQIAHLAGEQVLPSQQP